MVLNGDSDQSIPGRLERHWHRSVTECRILKGWSCHILISRFSDNDGTKTLDARYRQVPAEIVREPDFQTGLPCYELKGIPSDVPSSILIGAFGVEYKVQP